MNSSNVVLSPPLQQLKEEHVSLRVYLDIVYEITEEIVSESGPEVVELFMELYKQISSFTEKLNAHSKREEDWLFPMMTQHLGTNDSTIEGMESEHEKAELHLNVFLTEADKIGSNIDEQTAHWITISAVQAHATLIQHFAKEEKVLFPLAEKILSVEEKEELVRLFSSN